MKENFGWIMTLFGTAVGAGILFLPISAGMSGIIVLLVVTLLSIPTVYFAHRNIGVMLTEAKEKVDYTGAVNEFIGMKAGFWINLVFFIALFLLLIVYSSGLNNDVGEFMLDTGFTKNNLSNSIFLSLLILCLLIFIIRIGEKVMLRFMGGVTLLLVLLLIAVSAYLIPQWNIEVLSKMYSPARLNRKLPLAFTHIHSLVLLLPCYVKHGHCIQGKRIIQTRSADQKQ